MRPLEEALIEPDCVFIRRNLDTSRETRNVHAQRKDHVRTQQEDFQLQAKERGPRKKPANTWILGFQPPELWENLFLSLKAHSLWNFVMVARAD